jgi:hypothetical protein
MLKRPSSAATFAAEIQSAEASVPASEARMTVASGSPSVGVVGIAAGARIERVGRSSVERPGIAVVGAGGRVVGVVGGIERSWD